MKLSPGIALTALLSLGACPSPEADPTPDTVQTAAGMYNLELSAKPFSSVAEADLQFGIAGPSGPVTGAQVSLEPFMPAMGHGILKPPVVTELGGGKYRAKWAFSMAGDWELRFSIQSAAGKDTAMVEVKVE